MAHTQVVVAAQTTSRWARALTRTIFASSPGRRAIRCRARSPIRSSWSIAASSSPIAENEPVTENKVASLEAGAGLPPVIPEGMRAISVKVNEVVGVAGFVVPGTRVDVLVTVAHEQDERADDAHRRQQRRRC